MRDPALLSVILTVILLAGSSVYGQNAPCPIDSQTLQFVGKPIDQARCLLRPNGYGGVLGQPLERLPRTLEKVIGSKVKFSRPAFLKYIAELNVSESAIGGSLTDELSGATIPDGSVIHALYFIIHDTSTPNLRDETFPVGFNEDPDWRGNNLDVWLKSPVAHVFVSRDGRSLTATPFSESVKKCWGTKFARDYLKAPAKGLQLHIELVQPRRRDPRSKNPDNDLIAPTPGFSDAQYDRLALLYATASLRRGTWLIPGFHSAIDAGIPDAHDDPQNFELAKFASSLDALLRSLDRLR